MMKIASLAAGALLLAAPSAHAAPRVFIGVGLAAPVPVVAPVRVATVRVLPARVVPVRHAVPVRRAVPVRVAPVLAPPVAVVPAVRGYGYVWRPAYWMPGPRFVPGAWVRPPFARAVWVAPRYVARPHGRVWVAGYWR